MGEEAFSNRFPALYRLLSLHNAQILEFWVDRGGEVSETMGWNFHLRDLNDKEVEELLVLIKCLTSVRLCCSLEDKRVQLPDKNGGCSCKSCFNSLRESDDVPDFLPCQLVWKSSFPFKIKVFGWLVALAKLNTLDMQQRRRPFQALSPGWCILCRISKENNDNLFLHCKFALNLWWRLLGEFNLCCESQFIL